MGLPDDAGLGATADEGKGLLDALLGLDRGRKPQVPMKEVRLLQLRERLVDRAIAGGISHHVGDHRIDVGDEGPSHFSPEGQPSQSAQKIAIDVFGDQPTFVPNLVDPHSPAQSNAMKKGLANVHHHGHGSALAIRRSGGDLHAAEDADLGDAVLRLRQRAVGEPGPRPCGALRQLDDP